ARVRAAYGEEPAAVRALTMRIATRLTGLAPVRRAWVSELVVLRGRDACLLPLAAVGVAVNAIPGVVAMAVGRWVTRRLEMRASFTAITGLYLFPIFWLAVLAAVARAAGAQGVLMTAAAGVVTSWAALQVWNWRQDGDSGARRMRAERTSTPCMPR